MSILGPQVVATIANSPCCVCVCIEDNTAPGAHWLVVRGVSNEYLEKLSTRCTRQKQACTCHVAEVYILLPRMKKRYVYYFFFPLASNI
ncbi:hypothetical protein IF1G_04858 [Cordyceps javanica]|uniref:Uncharacterized protein n=1 Tax=Cordyceps javanica TaxID=43265 RepID=A0A545V3I7_9HYPO|nr:hypothetical protein IF1G_04858 [Cordyceps javanica]